MELTYAGQEVEITETSTGFYNERQKIEIDLNKVMEQNEVFRRWQQWRNHLGQPACSQQMKSLRQMAAASPLAGCSEVVECDENGYAAFSTDLPLVQKPS